VNALANPEVGEYLNKHFVSTYQKVGTFQIVNGQKQGGNVASYFCTPKNGVLDAVAGPVNADAFLREARWVVETRKMALLQAHDDVNSYKWFFRMAHAQQLPQSGGPETVNWQAVPMFAPTPTQLTAMIDDISWARSLGKQSQVHLLLAGYPLAPLDQVYPVVYEKIVGEKLSTKPVSEGANTQPVANLSQWTQPGGGCQGVISRSGPGRLTFPAHGISRAFNGLGGIPYQRPQPVSLEAMRLRSREQALRQAMSDPPRSEIFAAGPLNILVTDLGKHLGQDGAAQRTPLSPDVVQHLNVLAAGQTGNSALLRNGGKLDWPFAWRDKPLEEASGELRAALASDLHQALEQAAKGQVDAKLVQDMKGKVNQLRDLLKQRIDQIQPDSYTEASRYLDQVTESLKLLRGNDAQKYLNGDYTLNPLTITSVQDLVKYMTDKGLCFAPAASGDEGAYLALQRALASCDAADQAPPLAAIGEL
jgi:hypothetical protein